MLVLAIVMALAMPMLAATGDAKLRQAARLMVADLDFARVQSITHADDPRVVVLDDSANQYHLALESEPDVPLVHPATGTDYIVRFGAGQAAALGGVGIVEHNLEDDRLAFGIYGQVLQTDPIPAITLAVDGRQLTITLDPDNGEAIVSDITSP